MAATGFTPLSLYYSTTGAAVPVNTNLTNGELAINIADGKLYYKDSLGAVKLLASNAGSLGDVVGPASATDTAIATFDGTTGKLIKNNSAVTIGTTGNTVISVTDSTNAALRVTQLSTATNAIAFLVEDVANPDPTPFVIDANGRVVTGNTSAVSFTGGLLPQMEVLGNTNNTSAFGIGSFRADAGSGYATFLKSRSATVGTLGGVVVSGDSLGTILWNGDDGTAGIQAASISASVDGTPGTNDMPGRLTFSTTADGASAPTERMRINSAGNVGIGSGVNQGDSVFTVVKNMTGATTTYGIRNFSLVQSDSVTSANSFQSSVGTASFAFTVGALRQYYANGGTNGSGAIVSNNFGYMAESSLNTGTSNFGFYGNIAAPITGITTAGTINTISSSGTTVTVSHNAITYTNGQTVTIAATANATALVSGATATILTVGTTDYTLIGAASNTVGVSFTATGAGTGTGTVTLNVQGSGKNVAGAASGSFTYTTTTSQTFAAVTVLAGTVTVSTRYNLYMNGTAANYLAGSLGIGVTPAVGRNFQNEKTLTGAIGTYAQINAGVIQSDVTSAAYYYSSYATTASSNFAISQITHYNVGGVSTFPNVTAGGSVGSQYGFLADSNLIGATNNYGFYGNIASGANRWNLYMSGTAANYLGGDTIVNGKIGLGAAASPSYGTSGQVLTSAGSGASPTWSTPVASTSISQIYFLSQS